MLVTGFLIAASAVLAISLIILLIWTIRHTPPNAHPAAIVSDEPARDGTEALHAGATPPNGVVAAAAKLGLSATQIDQILQQGVTVWRSGVHVYSPESLCEHILSIHRDLRIQRMWLVLLRPADLDPPFYEFTAELVRQGVVLHYRVPPPSVEMVKHLRETLKTDPNVHVHSSLIEQRITHSAMREAGYFIQNCVFLTAGRGSLERRYGFVGIRNDEGKTCLVYDMPPGERSRFWPEKAEAPEPVGRGVHK